MTTLYRPPAEQREFFDALDKLMALAPQIGLSWIRVDYERGVVERASRTWGKPRDPSERLKPLTSERDGNG